MSEGIVLELQRDALDENVNLENLLRKAYLVARKLQLEEFEEWISKEQNGYTGEVPQYRIVGGSMKAWNPMRGWIPMIFPKELGDYANKLPIHDSIASIIDSYNSSDGTISYTMGTEMTDFFNRNSDWSTIYNFFIVKSEFYGIMSTVRNKILDWALMLEESGVVGEGLSFSEDEKKIAKESQVINQYINNFYSKVKDIDVKQR